MHKPQEKSMIVRNFVLFVVLALAMPIAARAGSGTGREVSITAARIQAAQVYEGMQSRARRDAEITESAHTHRDEEKPHTRRDAAAGEARSLNEGPLGGNGPGAGVSK